jgi:hypothetical protein
MCRYVTNDHVFFIILLDSACAKSMQSDIWYAYSPCLHVQLTNSIVAAMCGAARVIASDMSVEPCKKQLASCAETLAETKSVEAHEYTWGKPVQWNEFKPGKSFSEIQCYVPVTVAA